MRTFDLTPLYRSAIGFDRLASLFDEVTRGETPAYPPYNIELVEEDKYRITMAVAGFAEDELDVEVEGDSLKVIGRKEK
ncbi:MAG: Hsp20 family protein, partial [Gammaproteobacteria bacterium]|nr:Hsp20 family protein [Gammaproteobacteria bacterium]